MKDNCQKMGILQEISLMKYDAVPIPSFFIKNKKSKEFCFYSLSVELKESKQGQLELERICDSQIVGYIDFLDILIRLMDNNDVLFHLVV